MLLDVGVDIIFNFQKTTGYDLSTYLSLTNTFINVQSNNIIAYYSGDVKTPDREAFNVLNELKIESNKIIQLFIVHKKSLETAEYWELLNMLEDIHIKLHTADNYSKWLRSSITKNNFNPDPEIEYILKQNQNLEKVSSDVQKSNDRDNDWYDIAIRNDMIEEDYTPEGGNNLKISFSNRKNLFLNSVVDNIFGQKILGADVQRKLEFENDDLKNLDNISTFFQAVEVLTLLSKGSNPEFLTHGIQKELFIGTDYGSIVFQALVRQFIENFSRDDTISAVEIKSVENIKDGIFIEFNVSSRINEIVESSVII